MPRALNAGAPPVPNEVLRYWRNKGIQPGFSWQDVYGEEHHHAFTAAKLMREDVLGIVREELGRSFAEGRTYESFVRGLRPRLEAAGFWGDQQVTDPLTGETVTVDVPTRLRRIYDTNMRTARAAGQWDRIQRTKESHPYLLYQVGPSVHHREEHLAWHGLCLPVDDPFWDAHFPPNGYGCKCNVRSVSRDEFHRLQQDGVREAIPEKVIGPDGLPTGHIRDRRVPIRTEAPPVELVEWTNQRTGDTRMVPRGVTPGFDRPPNVRTIEPRGMTPPPAPAAPPAPPAPPAAPTPTPASQPEPMSVPRLHLPASTRARVEAASRQIDVHATTADLGPHERLIRPFVYEWKDGASIQPTSEAFARHLYAPAGTDTTAATGAAWLYAATQSALRARGITEPIRLYRGLHSQQAAEVRAALAMGTSWDVAMRDLTSFTGTLDYALEQIDGDPHGVVIVVDAHVTRVLFADTLTPSQRTIGLFEDEYVLLFPERSVTMTPRGVILPERR